MAAAEVKQSRLSLGERFCAVALGLLAAGLLAFTAYQLTPSSGAQTIHYAGGNGVTAADANNPQCPAGVPLAASIAGYCANTLNSTVFTTSTIDMAMTYNAGFTWYAYNSGKTPGTGQVTPNTSNVVVGESAAGANTGGFQATLSSAAKIAGSPFYRGTAYGGGGYFEVTASFNAVSDPTATDWEAPLWTAALEDLALLPGYQWTGQTSSPACGSAPCGPYGHYFEGDVLEYFQGKFSTTLNGGWGTSHDWSGQNNSSDTQSTHGFTLAQAGFASPHKYAMLWRPATATKNGSVCYYFDGAQYACDSYTRFVNDGSLAPPAAGQPWLFGVVDIDHLVLIMGCTNANPCTISSVQVYQATAANNLTN